MIPAMVSELSALSARLGKDPLLVQGAGGNTSVKIGGELWVKGSGKWLARADAEPCFVPLDLGGVRGRIAAGEAEPALPEKIGYPEVDPALRPSIETTLHALMPHLVVVHVHGVNTVAAAVRAGGAAALEGGLDGLAWAWVDYRRPGLPLTRAVAERLSENPDVLILGNHGLVVGAADCAAAEALVDDVESRLQSPVRTAPTPDLARLNALAEGAPYRLPKHADVHGIATDPVQLKLALGGSLYPDHVVFLGPGVMVLEQDETVAERAATCADAPPAMLLAAGAGVLVRDDLTAGAEEMVLALARVLERIDPQVETAYLSAAQEAELLGWDAEKHRQQMDRERSR
jgi:rhamnose utilization protein RhaD (predicted bifunctional aldolase and dehydrogenase)